MKRTALRRKTPLNGHTPLRRMTRLRYRSTKKARADREAASVKAVVRQRDEDCVMHTPRLWALAGSCRGPLAPHHLRKAGQLGQWSEINCVLLCSWHNTWVEDNPAVAHRLGLVVRTGETIESAWDRMLHEQLPVTRPNLGGAA